MLRLLLSLVAASLLLGCTSPSRQLVPLPDQDIDLADRHLCRVYVALGGWTEAPRGVIVYDGERPIGIVEQETYLCWEREPGVATLRARYKDQALATDDLAEELEVELPAGEVRYVAVTCSPESVRPSLRSVGEEEGSRLVAGCRAPNEG